MNKLAISPANTTDADGLKHTPLPSGGVYAKPQGYCGEINRMAKAKNVFLCGVYCIECKKMLVLDAEYGFYGDCLNEVLLGAYW